MAFCALWKKGPMHDRHLRIGIYALSSWGQSIYVNTLELSYMGDLSILPNLFIAVWPHEYLSYNFSYDPILLYFFVVLFQLWPLWALSIDSCVPLTYLCHCVYVCFNTSFLPGTVRYSRLFLYISCPSPRFSHQPTGWFYLRKVLETEIWAAGVLFTFGYSQLTERKYVCILICIYTHTYKYIHTYICISNHFYLY